MTAPFAPCPLPPAPCSLPPCPPMSTFPRTREETSTPPSTDEISAALLKHWGLKAVKITQALSRRVHYVDARHRQVVFRANSGWDGPTPPPLIVQYVDHLSSQDAPVPSIVPTLKGELHATLRDYTLSVESRLPGEDMRENPHRLMHTLGQGLGQLHNAAKSFPDRRGQMRPAGDYIWPLFERSLARPLDADQTRAIDQLRQRIANENTSESIREIPWLFCRGDLAAQNVIATDEGDVSFTDFDSAEYAPALFDVVMTRFQWRMRDGLLNLSSVSDFVSGYQTTRPLTDAERLVFPVVWAAYYVDRLTFLHAKWSPTAANREWLPVQTEILKLPTTAVSLGEGWCKPS